MDSFRVKYEISNHGQPSLLPEIAFAPDGQAFAVSVQEQNEVRLYETATGRLLRCWKNPAAGFGEPHGVLLTERHLLVSNRNYFKAPSEIRVYSLNSKDDYALHRLVTPFNELVEAHSMTLSNGRLLVTYCEGEGRTGGVVCYAYDDERGRIDEPLSMVDACFHRLGDPKGVTFFDQGRRALVSFNSLKPNPPLQRLVVRSLRRWYKKMADSTGNVWRSAWNVLREGQGKQRKPPPILHNGLAVFAIDAAGNLSQEPERVLLRDEFCRLENVHCLDATCAVADTINGQVLLYDIVADPNLERPREIVREALSLPHGVKLSPDGNTLIVSNYGLRAWRQEIIWFGWSKPRTDTVAIYRREARPQPA
tara:strand:+ start:15110 stop:16204 length:1095 start_codon:yes stop_codon:yes gene_type:complete